MEMERGLAGRPQVVAEVVVVRVETRTPPQELPKVTAELVALAGLVVLAELVALAEPVAQVESEQASGVEMMMITTMTPTNVERQGILGSHPNSQWPVNNQENRFTLQFTLQSTGIWHPCTSHAERREPSWAIVYWSGLTSKRGRYMKLKCKAGW